MRIPIIIALLGFLAAICLLTTFFIADEPWVFFWASVLGSAAWLALMVLLRRELPSWMLAVILTTGLLMRLAVIGVGPVASDDVYRYIWDGKVQAHGIDPFLHAPESDELQALRSVMLPERINFPEMRTVYPPLAQWMFWLSYEMGGESITAFKLLLLLADALTVVLLLVLLRRFGRPSGYVAMYVVNPLIVFQFMVDGHLDVIAFPFVLAFILLMHARSQILAALALGASIAVKLLPLFYVPLLLRDAWKRRNAWFLLSMAVPVLAYLPYITGDGAPFESLGIYAGNWSFNASVFRVLSAVLPEAVDSRLLTQILTVIAVVVIALQKKDLIWKVAWTTFAYFVFAATVHPWYLTWLVLLLPLYPRWSFVAFTATVAIANFPGVWHGISGEWIVPHWMGPAVYLPVLVVLILELSNVLPSIPSMKYRENHE